MTDKVDDKLKFLEDLQNKHFLKIDGDNIKDSDLDKILDHMIVHNASDTYLHSGQKVLMDIHGYKLNVTSKPTSFNVIEDMAKIIAGDNLVSRINSGEYIDLAYEYKKDGIRYRFRVNLTSTYIYGKSAINITMRKIDSKPLPLDKIGLSKDSSIYKKMFPKEGLVLITGPTGSGKSTLMSSCLNEKVQEPECHRIFNAYESPIEYTYDDTFMPSARIFQTPVPTGVKTFTDGLITSLRRKPEVIVIGEMREIETISAAIDAGQTGHLVIGTSHTTGVPATARRLVTVFPKDERDGRQVDILDQLHMIVAQKLLKTIDGKRVAVRESLIFTSKIKNHLLNIEPLKLNLEIRKIMNRMNIGMTIEAKKYYEDGVISKDEYETLVTSMDNDNE